MDCFRLAYDIFAPHNNVVSCSKPLEAAVML